MISQKLLKTNSYQGQIFVSIFKHNFLVFSSLIFCHNLSKSSSFYHLRRRFSVEELQVHKKADFYVTHFNSGERGGSVVECRTPEREVGGSKPTSAVLCP